MKIFGIILMVVGFLGIFGSFLNPIKGAWDEKLTAYAIELIMIIIGIYLIKKSKTKKTRR
jgi:hypothetical protein